MKKDDYLVEIRNILKQNPFILVGVSDIEGEEICHFLKKEKIEFESVKLSNESPYWEEIPADIKEKVNNSNRIHLSNSSRSLLRRIFLLTTG